jgi:glycosyltransferase involved in cell wall biosynthesis
MIVRNVNILHPSGAMRIAIVSTPFVRIPPPGYGGTELFCGHLVEGLARRGHQVTLYATGDSTSSGEVKACFTKPIWPPSDAADVAHARFALHDIARDRMGYDAVQINSPATIKVAAEFGVPVAHTIHHHQQEVFSRIYAAHPEVHYVAISRRQLEIEVPLRSSSVIHHGVDEHDYPLSMQHEGYVLHLGRFAADKGTHHAIDAARRAGVPIVLAGRVHEKDDDHHYYDREIVPRIAEGGVDIVGEADFRHKVELLRGAMAVLCPIEWEEPFGLVAIEGMLAGTPLIGFPRGSFPEIVDEGVTGHLVGSVEEMATAIGKTREWDRARCAERARRRFSANRMAADYENLFMSMARRRRAPFTTQAPDPAGFSRLNG